MQAQLRDRHRSEGRTNDWTDTMDAYRITKHIGLPLAWLPRLRRDDHGSALLGYALGSAVISVPIVIAMGFFGGAATERASDDMADLAVTTQAQQQRLFASDDAIETIALLGESTNDGDAQGSSVVESLDADDSGDGCSGALDDSPNVLANGCDAGGGLPPVS